MTQIQSKHFFAVSIILMTSLDVLAISIMPFGDSITSGFHGTVETKGSYRLELERTFTALGADFDFVGEFEFSRSGLIDSDMQAVAGYQIEQMTAEFGPSVANLKPDIILIVAGTNNHWDPPVPDEHFRRYDDLVTMIRSNSPESHVVFSTLPKFGCCRPEWSESFVDVRNLVRIPALNDAMREVAANYEHVDVVDLFSIFDVRTDLVIGDYVHPNKSGQKKLSKIFLSKIGSHQGLLSVSSIDRMSEAIRESSMDLAFDVDHSGEVNLVDREHLIEVVLDTHYGDSNFDGRFNSSDLVEAFIAREYHDDIVGNSTWADGDWSGDGEFTSLDLILAFQRSVYEQENQVNHAIPEPFTPTLALIGIIPLLQRCRSKK